MNTALRINLLVLGPPLLLLTAAPSAWAVLNYQCPAPLLTQNQTCGADGNEFCTFDPKDPASSTDPGCKDPTSPTFYDDCKVQVDPVTGQASGATTDPGVLCRSITCGDGHVYMADRDRTGQNPDQGDIYIFGFADVTNVPEGEIMTRGNSPSDPNDPNSFPIGSAQTSAPTLTAREGQDLYLTLTNSGMRERPDLFDPHTVHYHGFPNAASVFDGEPMASFGINLGSSLTYFYRNENPGTYMYHCHVEASEHMQMGMLGSLYVTPSQDGTDIQYQGRDYTRFAYDDCPSNTDPMCGSTGYDSAFFLQETGFDPNFHFADGNYNKLGFADMEDSYNLFNGRGYPDTVDPEPIDNSYGNPSQPVPAIPFSGDLGSRTPLVIPQGQKLLLHVSSLNTVDFSTVRVLGIPMRIIGQGAKLRRGPTGVNTSYATDSFTLGGGEAVDVLLDTAGVAPGTYFIYTTNLNRLSNDNEDFGGQMTEIVVGPAV